jgi:hypothetical protein
MLLTIIILGLITCGKEHVSYKNPNDQINMQAGIQTMVAWDPPVNSIHIDPALGDDQSGDGSKENPYKSFANIKLGQNRVYAIKRSTTLQTGQILLNADGITIASYGIGKKPVLHFITDGHAISTNKNGLKNITIRDIEIKAGNATSCIKFGDYSKNLKVINCRLHGSEWGIRALNFIDGISIENTEVFNIDDDGIFIKNSKNIAIKHCYVHHVNMNWKPPSTPDNVAGGDGIQFHLCDNWHVHNNKIDRSTTGNKFCFISNNPNQKNGLLEKNWLIAPITNGSSVYIGDGQDMIIQKNFFQGPHVVSIYSHSENLQVYYNIFFKVKRPLFASNSAMVYNNIFYKASSGIEGGEIVSRNNVFFLSADYNNPYKVENLIESNNIHFRGLPRDASFVGDPEFIDPENLNFRVLPNSICIDNGTGVGLSRDFEGNPVPRGEATDIGVYEK